jgi:hypothetical protein
MTPEQKEALNRAGVTDKDIVIMQVIRLMLKHKITLQDLTDAITGKQWEKAEPIQWPRAIDANPNEREDGPS